MSIFFLCLTLLGAYLVALPFWLANFTAAGLLGLLFAYTKEKTWGWVRRITGYELPFGLLLFAAWWSVCDAYLPWQALGDALSLTVLIGAFYFLAAAVRSSRDFNYLLRVAFAGYILVLVCGFLQYGLTNWGWPAIPGSAFLLAGRGLNRISSIFIQRSGTNVFAAFLSLAAPAYLAWFWQNIAARRNKKQTSDILKQIFYTCVLALTIFNIIFSFSRALLVALAVVFSVSLARTKYWKQIFAAGIILAVLAVLFVAPLQKTIRSLFDLNDASNRDHYMLAEISLRQIAQRPLNGWGGGHLNAKLKQENGRWIDLRGKYKTPEELRRNYENMQVMQREALADGVIYVFSPHNMYLGYFVEYGFLSFLGSVLLIALTWRRLRRLSGGLAYSLALGILGFAVYGLFQDSVRAPIMAYLLWFYLLLVLKLEESLRGFNFRQYRKVLVLAYHRILQPTAKNTLAVSAKNFARQIDYLRRRKYLFMNVEDFYQEYIAQAAPLLNKICLITFDDGYRDNIRRALPLLKERRISATIFVTVQKIGSAAPYYWDFKNSTNFSKDDLPLDWPELKRLRKSGWAVGSHTLNHYELNQLADKELAWELRQSKKILEKNLSAPVNTVCYPRGATDKRTLKAAWTAGYRLGFVTNSRADDLLAFPRVGIYAHDTFGRFWLKLLCRKIHL
ncbi:MAG: polysaccharide deacetylase family protein [Candidatus Margulisbacteria bacterium]|jgi:peptidoglycan/xylan/chitin deacetylase (PgdA/CDA1 family)/O-antigen ligase|nr:polysaccharide deacetylase family protein [Candidatus Margulisiibacteriota bacterium]